MRYDPSMADQRQQGQQELNVKITDDELRGRYSNFLRVTHTRDEFVLDFINLVPPQGIVSSRIVTSPGHLKRIIRALSDNLARYEQAHGQISEAPEPQGGGAVN